MHFAHPSFLFVALLAAVTLSALYARLALVRRRALAQLGAAHLLEALTSSVSRARRRLKETMVVAGVALVAVALARPQLGYRFEQAHRRGVDVLFAVDTSKSMLTPDVKPDRLERAKLAVRDLVEKFPDDRVGLVAFAGSAFLETPLTLDHAIFEQSLAGLDTSVIPLGGTDVASAIDVAQKALADDEHKKVLVLLTDGEDLSGGALEAAQTAAKQGLVVYTVGVGTPRGELVPLPAGGPARFVTDPQGRYVTSKLDESLLRRIAEATGGSYRALGDSGQGLESLYREELATLPRSDLASQSERVPVERFQWPLGLGLLLLGAEPLVSERKRARSTRARGERRANGATGSGPYAAVSGAAFGLALLLARTASASPQSAERAYHDGHFAAAQAEYADAAKRETGDARLAFNEGAAAYRNGDLDTAAKGFEGALHTDDVKLQERGYYDLGDTTYRQGEATLKAGKTDDTIATWRRSVSDYEAALRLDAKDADAKYNLDFVKARLAELEKKQAEQPPKPDPKQQGADKQDKQDKQSGGAQNPNKGSSSSSSSSSSASSGSNAPQSGGGSAKGAGGQPHGPDQKGEGKNAGRDTGTPPTGQGAGTQPAAQGNPDQGSEEGTQPAPSRPGELSKGEAQALLDAMRGELQLKPTSPAHATAPEDQPRKDW